MAETLSQRVTVHRIGPHAKYRDVFAPDSGRRREDYFVFSFVRNPWARLVSTYFYILKGGRAEIDKQRRDKYLRKYNGDFKSFVRDIESWFSIREEESIYPDGFIPHFRPQCEFICNDAGEVMVDFIGRVEEINKDFKRLCDTFSMDGIRLSKSNKSSHRPYHTYYDEQTRDIVAKYYVQDIDTFNYSFGPKEKGANIFMSALSLVSRRRG